MSDMIVRTLDMMTMIDPPCFSQRQGPLPEHVRVFFARVTQLFTWANVQTISRPVKLLGLNEFVT